MRVSCVCIMHRLYILRSLAEATCGGWSVPRIVTCLRMGLLLWSVYLGLQKDHAIAVPCQDSWSLWPEA